MTPQRNTENAEMDSRRNFLKKSALGAAAMGGLSLERSVHAAGSDVIRIGMVGCGGRCTGAAGNAMVRCELDHLRLIVQVVNGRSVEASPGAVASGVTPVSSGASPGTPHRSSTVGMRSAAWQSACVAPGPVPSGVRISRGMRPTVS